MPCRHIRHRCRSAVNRARVHRGVYSSARFYVCSRRHISQWHSLWRGQLWRGWKRVVHAVCCWAVWRHIGFEHLELHRGVSRGQSERQWRCGVHRVSAWALWNHCSHEHQYQQWGRERRKDVNLHLRAPRHLLGRVCIATGKVYPKPCESLPSVQCHVPSAAVARNTAFPCLSLLRYCFSLQVLWGRCSVSGWGAVSHRPVQRHRQRDSVHAVRRGHVRTGYRQCSVFGVSPGKVQRQAVRCCAVQRLPGPYIWERVRFERAPLLGCVRCRPGTRVWSSNALGNWGPVSGERMRARARVGYV
jgi:hypothetical protein